MSLRKISPGVYVSVVPQPLEAYFERMCDDFAGHWKHPSTRQVAGRALAREEPSPDSNGHHPGPRPGSRSPCPYDRTPPCKGLCLTYTFAGPPRNGPPPARPDPCIPKGHVVVVMPKVQPENIPPPGPDLEDSHGHVVIVMPEEQQKQEEGPGNRSAATGASEPLPSPRSTSPQPSSPGKDLTDTVPAPSPSSSSACSSATAWVASASAPDAEEKGGQAVEQTSAAECVLCGDRFKIPGWH